jgi:predicted aspartyl protease
MPRIEGTKVGIDPLGRVVYRPIVIVQLEANGLGMQGPAIVDSGADTTMIPAEVAAGLGIDYAKLPNGTKGKGAGGVLESRPASLTIRYQSWTLTGEVSIAEPKHLDVVLLGRSDFFQRFVVRFNWFKSPPEFHLDPANSGKP